MDDIDFEDSASVLSAWIAEREERREELVEEEQKIRRRISQEESDIIALKKRLHEIDEDAIDIWETLSDKEREKRVKEAINQRDDEFEGGVPFYDILDAIEDDLQVTADSLQETIKSLRTQGKIYEPSSKRYRVT